MGLAWIERKTWPRRGGSGMRHNDARARTMRRRHPRIGPERIQRHAVVCIDEARRQSLSGAPALSIPNPTGGGLGMHSVFYIIGVIVVVLAILSLLGLA